MEDIASVEFRGEPPSVYSFVGLRLVHGDNLAATAIWDNDAGVNITLESRGTVVDLLPPDINGTWTPAGVDPSIGACHGMRIVVCDVPSSRCASTHTSICRKPVV